MAIQVGAAGLAAQEASVLLHVTARSGNAEIERHRPGIDPVVLAEDPADDIFPRWSRDGQSIAFSSQRGGGVFELFIMNADGGDLRQLALMPKGDSLAAAWSPAGGQIVFQHGRENHWDLWVAQADGERWRRVVHNAWQPDWSPDREAGEKLAFVSARHDAGLMLFTSNPDGTDIRARVRLSNKIGMVYPMWSPDGQKIAYTDRVLDSHEIFICGDVGQDVRQLTALGRRSVYPSWSADGAGVYFLHQQEDKLWQWMRVDVATREVTPVASLPAAPFLRGGRSVWK